MSRIRANAGGRLVGSTDVEDLHARPQGRRIHAQQGRRAVFAGYFQLDAFEIDRKEPGLSRQALFDFPLEVEGPTGVDATEGLDDGDVPNRAVLDLHVRVPDVSLCEKGLQRAHEWQRSGRTENHLDVPEANAIAVTDGAFRDPLVVHESPVSRLQILQRETGEICGQQRVFERYSASGHDDLILLAAADAAGTGAHGFENGLMFLRRVHIDLPLADLPKPLDQAGAPGNRAPTSSFAGVDIRGR